MLFSDLKSGRSQLGCETYHVCLTQPQSKYIMIDVGGNGNRSRGSDVKRTVKEICLIRRRIAACVSPQTASRSLPFWTQVDHLTQPGLEMLWKLRSQDFSLMYDFWLRGKYCLQWDIIQSTLEVSLMSRAFMPSCHV